MVPYTDTTKNIFSNVINKAVRKMNYQYNKNELNQIVLIGT